MTMSAECCAIGSLVIVAVPDGPALPAIICW
jgi:hypothetical protein